LYHVTCVVTLVRQLLTQLPESLEPLVGTVTPYKDQKTHLRDELERLGYLHRVHVGTVHGFQSLERSIVIFDIVEGPPIKIGRFISDVWGDQEQDIASDATRLIKVAHSRARDKIIYVANLAYIQEAYYRREHQLTKFVEDAAARGYIPSRDLQ
ncbi:MAG: AAA domain-containing protein, partial [Nitrososphaerales archaeon]